MSAPRPTAIQGAAPPLSALERLATSSDIRDRAFAASVLSLRRDVEDREQVRVLYEQIRCAARTHHADVRRRIVEGTLDRRAFVAHLREAPLEIRDHLVEEILDVAYPPLDETPLGPEAIHYCPSGIAEILFMLENADLCPGKTFVDLGSGLGKVVLTVALLTGARAYGVEVDSPLVFRARSAACSLRLDEAHFIEGDLRDIPLPAADVYYMYVPLIRSTAIVERLREIAAERSIRLFSQALDLTRLPWLSPGHAASYWLQAYDGTETPRMGRGARAGREA